MATTGRRRSVIVPGSRVASDSLRAQVKANQADIADLRREYAIQLRRCSQLQQEIDDLKKQLQTQDGLSGRVAAMQAQLDHLSASHLSANRSR
jgi:hypothetical protein